MISVKYWVQIFLLSLAVICDASVSAGSEHDWLSQKVSLEFSNEPLRRVLSRLSSETDVAIMYDESLGDEPVTGLYNKISLEKALMRLFKNTNNSLIIHEAKRLVMVKHFGAKQYVWAESLLPDLPSPEGMTAEELERLHDAQYREYRADIEDGYSAIEGGMTRSELKDIHSNQYAQYNFELSAEGNILNDGSGMTREEVVALHEDQYADYKAVSENDDEVLEGGMTRGMLRLLHSEQYSSYSLDKTRESAIVEGGMSLKELRELHSQQYEDIASGMDGYTN